MKLDRLHIRSQFKNLSDFRIDFDEASEMTVMVGRNGTGKSNLLETLTIIFRAVLVRIQVPTLVLVGDEDMVTPLAASVFLADNIPGAALVTIPGAGHLTNIEKPDAFNVVLETFLAVYMWGVLRSLSLRGPQRQERSLDTSLGSRVCSPTVTQRWGYRVIVARSAGDQAYCGRYHGMP